MEQTFDLVMQVARRLIVAVIYSHPTVLQPHLTASSRTKENCIILNSFCNSNGTRIFDDPQWSKPDAQLVMWWHSRRIMHAWQQLLLICVLSCLVL